MSHDDSRVERESFVRVVFGIEGVADKAGYVLLEIHGDGPYEHDVRMSHADAVKLRDLLNEALDR